MRRFGRRKKINLRRPLDMPLINSHVSSPLFHFTFLLAMLFLWVETEDIKRPNHVFFEFGIAINADDIEEEFLELDPTPEESEEDDLGDDLAKMDDSAKAFEGD